MKTSNAISPASKPGLPPTHASEAAASESRSTLVDSNPPTPTGLLMSFQPHASNSMRRTSYEYLHATAGDDISAYAASSQPPGTMWSPTSDEDITSVSACAVDMPQAAQEYQDLSRSAHYSPSSKYSTPFSRSHLTNDLKATLPAGVFACPASDPYLLTSAIGNRMPPATRNSPVTSTHSLVNWLPQARNTPTEASMTPLVKNTIKGARVGKPYRHADVTHASPRYGTAISTFSSPSSASLISTSLPPRLTQPLSTPHELRSNALDGPASHVGTSGKTPIPVRIRTPRETQGGKDLARALGILGGRENPVGPGTSGFNFTFGSLVEVMHRHPGQIKILRDSLLDEADFAPVFQADGRLSRHFCNEALLENPANTPSEDTYVVDLGHGFVIALQLAPDMADSFKRGGGGTIPPEGLVRIATEMEVDMTGYRVDGAPHPVYSIGAPKQVDVRLMGSTAITIVELAVWFPAHSSVWPEWTQRFDGNGWTQTNITALINQAYNTDPVDGVVLSTIGEQMNKFRPSEEIQAYLDVDGQPCQRTTATTAPEVTVFSCENWTAPKDLRLVDYYVRDLANGVDRSKFPSRPDRGVLTQVIEHIVDNLKDWGDLKLSQIEWFVEHSGVDIETINPFPAPGMVNPDVEAFRRHKKGLFQYREMLKRYRLRQEKEQAEAKVKSHGEAEQ